MADQRVAPVDPLDHAFDRKAPALARGQLREIAGLMTSTPAIGPCPLASIPWQVAQWVRYSSAPASALPGLCADSGPAANAASAASFRK